MEDHQRDEMTVSSGIGAMGRLLRVFATLLGIVAIVVGLVYAVKIFDLVYTNLRTPGDFRGVIEQWASAVGGEELDVAFEGGRVPLASIVAVLIVGGGVVVLAWVAMGIMLTGAKIVSWTASERDAVKKILTHAFGPTRKPPSGMT